MGIVSLKPTELMEKDSASKDKKKVHYLTRGLLLPYTGFSVAHTLLSLDNHMESM